MNRTLRALTILLIIPTGAIAQIDCLSTTKQLKEAYDHKEYGPVACTCPCDNHKAQGFYSADRNKCLQCLHFHYPRPFIYVSQTEDTPTPLLTTWHNAPQRLMANLIARYQTKTARQTLGQ